MSIKGSKSWEWGKFEALRLWGAAWPMLIGVGAILLTQLATDVTAEVSVPLGACIGLVAKWLQQFATDNSDKRL